VTDIRQTGIGVERLEGCLGELPGFRRRSGGSVRIAARSRVTGEGRDRRSPLRGLGLPTRRPAGLPWSGRELVVFQSVLRQFAALACGGHPALRQKGLNVLVAETLGAANQVARKLLARDHSIDGHFGELKELRDLGYGVELALTVVRGGIFAFAAWCIQLLV
jgi:hypothetical protein